MRQNILLIKIDRQNNDYKDKAVRNGLEYLQRRNQVASKKKKKLRNCNDQGIQRYILNI